LWKGKDEEGECRKFQFAREKMLGENALTKMNATTERKEEGPLCVESDKKTSGAKWVKKSGVR